ncbi:MAG: right-handed parallel beta-helix repeat-containing protein [Planctomycetes bacterium]|nr:right-handed parallel beta-helix repeat-containing protein [Planctomycetota bacterium]
MRRILVGFLCLAMLPFMGRSFAQDTESRAEIIQFLAENVDAVLRAGEKPKAWLVIFGPRAEYPIVKADEKAVTVMVQGNAYPAPWSKIENTELLGIAKSVANGKGERLLVAVEVALALGLPDEANRLLAMAREADPALEKKINHLASEVLKAAPLTEAPKPKPAAPEKPPAAPGKTATASASPAAPPASSSTASAAPLPVTGNVIQVGPTRPCKTIASGVAKANAGSTVVVDPGTYNECLKVRGAGTAVAPIRILGVSGPNGERPLIDGSGVVLSGVGPTPRALMQVEGEHVIVENLEFKNARNGNNGAGIRLNGSTFATVRNCKITYCDMGIQGGDKETALIERSEVAFNGTKDYDGYSHNFYMVGNAVVLRECYVHDSLFGQNYKSRAHYNELWYNYICDSEEGEIGLIDDKETEQPNSNGVLVGNVVVSKVRGGNRNASKYIDFGTDTGKKHDGTLYCFHNTFIAGTPRITFVSLSTPDVKAVLTNNVFWGSDKIAAGKGTDIKGTNNLFDAGGNPPGGVTNSVKVGDAGWADLAKRDFHLRPGSACINAGAPADQLVYMDGKGQKFTAVADRQPLPPLNDEPRAKNGAPDAGAYELSDGSAKTASR